MNITVIGAGAMGSLFGGYLSKKNCVTVVDVNSSLIDEINKNGVRIKEKNGTVSSFFPFGCTNTVSLGYQDLVIVFVKSMFTISSLESNKGIIGPNTYLLTLQNGAGHESKLLKFADRQHVIIGTTQHNSSVISPGYIFHGGVGETSIGLLEGNPLILQNIANLFTECGFDCKVCDSIQKQIWQKLFTNTAASSVTALLQVPLGFIHKDPHANWIMRNLCKEAVDVANALGLDFCLEDVIADVENVCTNAPEGFTSIYSDIHDGRQSEVDTISGSVAEAARTVGLSVPFHELIIHCIHALENKNKKEMKK